MTCLYVLLSFLVSWVTGSPLELTSPPESNKIQPLTPYGVDISKCTQLRFRLKACAGVHVLLGDGTASGSYEIFIGGNNFNWTGLRRCSLVCHTKEVKIPTHGLLNCLEHRNFWVSWGNGITFGTGNIPYSAVLLNVTGPLVHNITVLGHFGNKVIPSTIKLGDDNISRFKLVGKDIKYTSTPLTDTTNKTVDVCGRLCHAHSACGRFSYSHAQTRCVLFERKPSVFSVTSEPGWASWRMIYCH